MADKTDGYYEICRAGVTRIGGAAGLVVGAISAGPTAGLSLIGATSMGVVIGFGVGYLVCSKGAAVLKSTV